MALDNYKDDNSGGRQQGATLPFDDNATDGITTNFWQATIGAYDGAVEAYEDAKSKAATSAADEDKTLLLQSPGRTPLRRAAQPIRNKARRPAMGQTAQHRECRVQG